VGIGVGGGGIIGFAHETVAGTYVVPIKFTPVLSENLTFTPGNQYRRPVRQTVDAIGVVPGNVSIGGTLSMECLDDVIVYFLYCMRNTIVKSGSTNFTYTITPTATPSALPTRTMSITVVRNGVTFGYVGCVVSKLTLSIQNDLLQMDCDIMGLNEASQTLPTPTWPTSAPYGPGTWNVQVPTSSQVFDMDTFSFDIDEAGAAQYRLKNTGANSGRGAQFISMGERTTQLTASRDFLDRTDYNAFQAGTAQSVTIQALRGANNGVSFVLGTAYKTSYDPTNGAQGDIVRASITYDTTNEASGNVFTMTVQTQENIT